jgi:hypothetical protein
VKSRLSDLRAEVAQLEEGAGLQTSQMRAARAEDCARRLAAACRRVVVRVRLPCRHIVQVRPLLRPIGP